MHRYTVCFIKIEKLDNRGCLTSVACGKTRTPFETIPRPYSIFLAGFGELAVRRGFDISAGGWNSSRSLSLCLSKMPHNYYALISDCTYHMLLFSSASYDARKFGIRSAMPISRAWKLCPEGVYLRPHFDLYIPASNSIMEILKSHADKFEQGGKDEAYLDI
jgi:hypothetical protein